MRNIELLAPAGSIEILKTAVHAGADAIYIGGPAFSARAGAKNFTYEEMKDGIEYAHLYNKKVFVAVNTLVKDEELKKLLRYMEELAKLAPDAVIIQDLGVARLFHEYVPEVPLHASTQLTATNRYSIQALKKLGFRRVVLGRELRVSEIAEIVAADPEVQIESFIHGAQCFSYSGQCLMSSMIGGRSGNRGQCAQPCRLPYQLKEREGTLISPKDLFGLPHLAEIARTGVHTIKIEGRLKNRDYVYYTVKAYRSVLDQLQKQEESSIDLNQLEKSINNLTKGIRQIFNREFSSGYLAGDLGQDYISLSRHNNKGIPIGNVSDFNYKNRLLTIDLHDDITIGDGIYVENKGTEGFGFTISEMLENGSVVTNAKLGQQIQLPLSEWDIKERGPNRAQTGNGNLRVSGNVRIAKGSIIYKSFDKRLSQEINEQDQPEKIGISFILIAEIGQQIILQYRDADNNSGDVRHEYIVQKAMKHPVTEEAIKKQLERLGNTPFILKELITDVSPDGMIPSSVLNELRRLAIDECTAQRIDRKEYQVQGNIQDFNIDILKLKDRQLDKQYNEGPILIAKVDDVGLIQEIPEEYQRIYFTGPIDKYKKAVELAQKKPVYIVISSMIKEHQVGLAKQNIEAAVKAGVTGFVVNQIGQREIIKLLGPDHEIIFDTGLNVFNQMTYHVLKETQPNAINLSLELNRQQLKEFKKTGFVYIHGRYRLMISEHSLLSANNNTLSSDTTDIHRKSNTSYLKDRKDFDLPTIENEFGQVEIFNAHVTSLLTELMTLKKHRHQGYIVDVSRDFYNNQTLKTTLSMYADAFSLVFNKEHDDEENIHDKLEELQQMLSHKYKGNITKGHWQRGVK